MTNEEIRRWNFEMRDDGLYFCAGEHDKALGCEFEKLTPELFLSTARGLVSQAYEEAARKGDDAAERNRRERSGELVVHYPQSLAAEQEARRIAASIRALKDSLCPHEWTDARNEAVTSGEVCLKCGTVRAGNAASVNEPVSSS